MFSPEVQALLEAAKVLDKHFSFGYKICYLCEKVYPEHTEACRFAPLTRAIKNLEE